jgi:predicted dinucleotide-binding enzyme
VKVGILSSDNVGQALGVGFATLGHDVKIGSREPQSDKLRAWVARVGERTSTGTFAEAAAYGEVVVLATLWSGTESALDLAGQHHLASKVVLDVTNPLAFDQDQPRLAVGHTDSGGEQVQRWLPESRVVKAFNMIGNPFMVRPDFPAGAPDMFICGDDQSARAVVSGICRFRLVGCGRRRHRGYSAPRATRHAAAGRHVPPATRPKRRARLRCLRGRYRPATAVESQQAQPGSVQMLGFLPYPSFLPLRVGEWRLL